MFGLKIELIWLRVLDKLLSSTCFFWIVLFGLVLDLAVVPKLAARLSRVVFMLGLNLLTFGVTLMPVLVLFWVSSWLEERLLLGEIGDRFWPLALLEPF